MGAACAAPKAVAVTDAVASKPNDGVIRPLGAGAMPDIAQD